MDAALLSGGGSMSPFSEALSRNLSNKAPAAVNYSIIKGYNMFLL